MLRRVISTVLLAVLAAALLGGAPPVVVPPPPPPADPAFTVLVFSRTAGYRHDSIPAGLRAIHVLGREHGFQVDATEQPAVFTSRRLAKYAAIIFLNTTGDVLDERQQEAFRQFIRNGGGYVGIHAAADCEYDWPWYGALVGAYFKGHPHIQEATVIVEDRTHPSTKHLPERWQRRDEWYDYRASPREKVRVLASLDEASYEGGSMGGDHPIAWCHEFAGGRAWYTGGGHTKESFEEETFLGHLLGGIRWAAGVEDVEAAPADDPPAAADPPEEAHPPAGEIDKVILDSAVTDPMELAVAPDGRVVFVERGGVVKIWSPLTRATVTAGFLDVFTALEDGLLGVALDPDFMSNGWIYLCYSPAGDEAKNVVSRFRLDGDTLDLASERVLLEIATQREECCHSGGSLAFGSGGNLFISTGDNTSPFASDGYAPIDERGGRGPFDAQKSSGNTHDLRGKVLRIHPEPDGTYTIPAGNLFPPDGSEGRPEIYVMGCRNPFRISVDPATGWLYWGDVGPDAGSPHPERGPAGHDEFNQARGPGNFGWPYFTADNQAYHDYDFDTGVHGEAFDPARPVNDSPNNTGRRVLPPAQPAWIFYPYDASAAFPELASGGRCAMAGPVYHFDANLPSPHRLPAAYDGVVFIYEWARDWIRAVTLDEKGDIARIEPFAESLSFTRPMDMELGPDGHLYMIEWGTGFGGGNRDAQLVRLDYFESGMRPPVAVAGASVTSGPVPLAVDFRGTESRSRAEEPRLSYAWDFDGDGMVDARGPEARHTYDRPANVSAQLIVTDARGLTAVTNVPISAGNAAPVVRFDWPPDGGIFEFGDAIDYRVTVHDLEDDPVDPARIRVQPALGHDTHAHPLHEYRGDAGTFQTLRDDGHGADADLFTVVTATYGDLGAPGVRPLTSRDRRILQPRRKQAEYFTDARGGRIEKTDDTVRSGESQQAVVFERDGEWTSYRPVNLHGIHEIALRIAPPVEGGRLELRLDGPDGAAIGAIEMEPQGQLELATGRHALRVEFFENTGGAGLILRIRGGGLEKQVVPSSMLSHGSGAAAESTLGSNGGDGRAATRPGLRASYYELLSPSVLPDFRTLAPYARGVVESLDFASTNEAFAGSGRAERVGAVFTGFITVPRTAEYAFFLESDDGSRLFIDEELVVDNDGLHAMVEVSLKPRWTERVLPVTDPGGTHELYLVYRTEADETAPCRVNWLEFRGVGVRSKRAADHDDAKHGHDHGHDH